jgi:HEAT repeat protein
MSMLNQESPERTKELVSQLRSKNPMERRAGREKLVASGRAAVVALMELSYDPTVHSRWEAVKALGEIASPTAIPALLDAMDDEEFEVRWLAAEGLMAIGYPALRPLLSALIRRSGSIAMSGSAHHALTGLTRKLRLPWLRPVIRALAHQEPGVTVPPVAYDALQQLSRQELAIQRGIEPPPALHVGVRGILPTLTRARG